MISALLFAFLAGLTIVWIFGNHSVHDKELNTVAGWSLRDAISEIARHENKQSALTSTVVETTVVLDPRSGTTEEFISWLDGELKQYEPKSNIRPIDLAFLDALSPQYADFVDMYKNTKL